MVFGAWVPQCDESLTLDFTLDHDLRVVEIEPRVGSMLNVEPA